MAEERLRASHEDRDRVVDQLRVAAGDGRLTSGELDERLERALSARTYGELAALTEDLPTARGAAPAADPKKVLRIERAGTHVRRDGSWVVPERIELRVTAGNVVLDFTQAVITQPSLQIHAIVRGGNLTLITRPGIVVNTDEVAIIGGRVIVREPPEPPVPVLLPVNVSGRLTGGNVRVRPPKPPRRTLWHRARPKLR
ncbi:MAG: DUF1707 domain-containing protein [Streptosporangiaceae bacterium]|nr:DUF1707 domain-containing protein [Streptosporangiaceae bacterium]